MFLFYVLSLFKKGDTIQGGSLFKGGHYLRKYGISVLIDVQANLPETSPCFGGFGEHLFSMYNFGVRKIKHKVS